MLARMRAYICHMHVYTIRVTFYGKEGVESIKAHGNLPTVVGCGLKRKRASSHGRRLPVTPPRGPVKVHPTIVYAISYIPRRLNCRAILSLRDVGGSPVYI